MEKYVLERTEINIESLPTLHTGIVNINFLIGAANDQLPTGSAHFLEHIFCSAHNFQKGKLTAQTQRDETNYYFYISDENIDTVFQLDWQISIDGKILEQERNTIINEIEQFNLNPRNRALEYLQSLVFNGKGYGKSILGSERQISQIDKMELERGIEYYNIPASINIIGPWKKDYLIDCINNSGIIRKSYSNDSSQIHPLTIGRGETSLPRDIKIPFIGGGWYINLNKTVRPYVDILKNIWDIRIKKLNPEIIFNLRINLYDHGGIFTIDSISNKADQDCIEKIILNLEPLISLEEFNKALVKMLIHEHRLSEDLQTRIAYLNSLDYQHYLTLEKTQEVQKVIMNHILTNHGLYLLQNPQKKISYYPLHYLNMTTLKEKNLFKVTDDTKEKQKIKEKNNPLIYIRRKGSFYYTACSSPLTKRYHVLFRIDCKGIGRLLLPNELPSEISIRGTLENVRYEGWHTLYHISFFGEKSMKQSIINSLSFKWDYERYDSKINEEKYMINLEIEMKRKITKALRTTPKKDKANLIGISIVTPEDSFIDEGYFENFPFNENKAFLLSERNIIEKRTIKARFHGIAIISHLPKQSISSLILQEAAFGTNTAFPTLESLVRKKGLSYRIVQSLISDNNELYIFWGIQCDPSHTFLFKDTVREWIIYLGKYADEVERWFKDMWVYFNPKKHSSILQLSRDMDRMGQYSPPVMTNNLDFKEFINELMLEELTEIFFTK
ncbi:insulinase family protein [Bacillus litorisediminis]|uniref:insulinase family protein n=1 Tax=Bacillus litorisediminis TaxID=2922713 RepID=UPI001FAED011|nr:insulinase family protein [Bacillus litorisediminis]